MNIIVKAIMWSAAFMLVSLAGAEGWISKAQAMSWIGTLPAMAVIHMSAGRKSCFRFSRKPAA